MATTLDHTTIRHSPALVLIISKSCLLRRPQPLQQRLLRVGGVEVAEMNGLELELLFALRFRLNVTPDTFARYCAALEGEMMLAPAAGVGDLVPLLTSPPEKEHRDHQDAAFTAPPQRAIVVEIVQ
ncbi:hypothetical protein PR202_gb06089 [Eleusine coracana subsp. coracana]|uniref:Uncharacterized protein n=1 Tax=Eleusine coracana subsp. coracana TaxID=191504 RepID=A0AAV5E6Z7_ELECO|nr:hypothetical protein PR202_gb06089 [Eleusine coracana subsp. coracana]